MCACEIPKVSLMSNWKSHIMLLPPSACTAIH
ncbi:hypothetical protein RSAG8_04221, partial [Rhizoctonia solani AG-8 WAC10335]